MTVSPLLPQSTFFRPEVNSAYDVEKELFRSILRESQALHGIPLTYYVTTFNTSAPMNQIFAEDRNGRNVTRKFTVQGYMDLPSEKFNMGVFGFDFIDNVHFNCEMEHFASASTYDYTMATSGSFPSIIPAEGDLMLAEFNNTFYEIVTVKQAQSQFLKTQHQWSIEMKVLRQNNLDVSASLVSGTDTDTLESLINDIFDISTSVSGEAPSIEYTPGPTEQIPGPGIFNGF